MKYAVVLIFALVLLSACSQDPNNHTITYISFCDLAPEGYILIQSWDATGIDPDDNVYIGFTAFRPDGLEDFLLFSYNHQTGDRRFLGSFMQAAADANNLHYGEEMPKGHTRLVYVNGMVYMASQSFHDFKTSIDHLEDYRGAHIFRYEIATGLFTNVTAHLPGGVVIPHEGIIALSHMPSAGYLVGLTHPHSNIVLIDLENYQVSRIIKGIPWEPGTTVSRDFVVDDINQRIFLYRGVENVYRIPGSIYTRFDALREFPVYVIDINTDTAAQRTGSSISGGMWGTSLVTSDGLRAYVSTVGGFLVEVDFVTDRVRLIGNLLPGEFQRIHRLNSLYVITFSPCETRLYSIPTYAGYITGLFQFCLETRDSTRKLQLPARVYTGNGIRDSHGNMYFAAFGYHNWSGDCRLLIIRLED